MFLETLIVTTLLGCSENIDVCRTKLDLERMAEGLAVQVTENDNHSVAKKDHKNSQCKKITVDMLKDTDKIILYKQGDFTDYDFVGIENGLDRDRLSRLRFAYYNKEDDLIDNALEISSKQLQNVDIDLTELKELLDSNGICLTDNQKMIIIKIERGMMITWDNKKSSHFVVSNKNGYRTMIGPCDNVMKPVGAYQQRALPSTAGRLLTECELPVRKSYGNTPNHCDLKILGDANPITERGLAMRLLELEHTLEEHSSGSNIPEELRNDVSNVCYTDVSSYPNYFGLILENDTPFECIISRPLNGDELDKINDQINQIELEHWEDVNFEGKGIPANFDAVATAFMLEEILAFDRSHQSNSKTKLSNVGKTIKTTYNKCEIYKKLKNHINNISNNYFKDTLPNMQIFIYWERLGGTLRPLNVKSDDTIQNIKELIQKEIEIEPEDQRLSFTNLELVNTKTVSDYDIQTESILDLTLIDEETK